MNAQHDRKIPCYTYEAMEEIFSKDPEARKRYEAAEALRAIEIQANVILKGTRVDGVYDKDPEKFPDARKFEEISYQQAYDLNLKIMDLTAFTLCKENKLPIVVFDMNKENNLLKLINGEKIGTKVN
jgi:uridylate kinase